MIVNKEIALHNPAVERLGLMAHDTGRIIGRHRWIASSLGLAVVSLASMWFVTNSRGILPPVAAENNSQAEDSYDPQPGPKGFIAGLENEKPTVVPTLAETPISNPTLVPTVESPATATVQTKTETQSSLPTNPSLPLPTNLPTKGSRIEKFGGGLKDIIIEVKNPSGYETRPLEQFKGAVYGLKGTELPGSDLLGFYGQDDKFYIITSIKNKTFQVALPEDLLDNTPAATIPAPETTALPENQPAITPLSVPTKAPPPPQPVPSPTQKTELTPTPAAPVERELNLNIPGLRIFNTGDIGIDISDWGWKDGKPYNSGLRSYNRDKLAALMDKYAKGRQLVIWFFVNVDDDPVKDQSKKGNFYTYFAQTDGKTTTAWIAVSAGKNSQDLTNTSSLLSQQMSFVIASGVLENFLANNPNSIINLQASSPSRPSDIKIAIPSLIDFVPAPISASETKAEFKIAVLNRSLTSPVLGVLENSKENQYSAVRLDFPNTFPILERINTSSDSSSKEPQAA